MKLKLLALLTIAITLILFIIGFVFELPVAYVPENATTTEFVLYHLVFVISEVAILSYLFTHMIIKSKLDLYTDLKGILS
jgi:NADH:ubiquinone oxidoreductase subunit 3 (subunit A)